MRVPPQEFVCRSWPTTFKLKALQSQDAATRANSHRNPLHRTCNYPSHFFMIPDLAGSQCHNFQKFQILALPES